MVVASTGTGRLALAVRRRLAGRLAATMLATQASGQPQR